VKTKKGERGGEGESSIFIPIRGKGDENFHLPDREGKENGKKKERKGNPLLSR